ncbi:glycosyltransferase family 2 protein [Bifidobacterium scaligerum]|uniref:glycosyltransferase family 2 protein n=1 Tax=Bifidobacterium scaligerum TaxID=2052656 RepID=UPI0013FD4612|nr:glycosyltransferase family A protein [Bifidobacterium scaligerum]
MQSQGFTDLSIIIPVYNVSPLLFHRCLESITKQDGISAIRYEIIVVVDGAENNQDLLNSGLLDSDSHIHVIVKSAGGVAQARNRGIDEAIGRWILFVDADDYLPDGAIQALFNETTSNNADIIVSNHARQHGQNQQLISYYDEKKYWDKTDSLNFIQHVLSVGSDQGTVWAKLFKSRFLKNSNERFDSRLLNGEDQEYLVRLVRHMPNITAIPDNTYIYVYNPSSSVRSFNNHYLEDILQTVNVIDDDLRRSELSQDVFNTVFGLYCLDRLLLLIMNWICNPNAPWSYRERRMVFRETCRNTHFAHALKTVPLNRIDSITRRITLFFAKNNLFLLISFIAWLRHRQLKH